MTSAERPRILVVDDEEAILETMTFTFMDDYEVLTSTDARRALDMLDESAPVAVVITDQRMPEMTGVEFLSKVVETHPETVRIMLTGFADMEATIQAINDGQLYAYVNKPWEPEQLKHVVRRAAEHHNLILLNEQLVEDLRRANVFLQAVMDRLDTGAIALDPGGVVRAANAPARTYLNLGDDPREKTLAGTLAREGLEKLADTVERLQAENGGFEDVEVARETSAHRIRVTSQELVDPDGSAIGSVILFKEISHEPLRRRFDELIHDVSTHEGDLRGRLEKALDELRDIDAAVRSTGIASGGMAELSDRLSRTQTALQNWLDVDDTLAREDFPDAQILIDRMRVAGQRWPLADSLPPRVDALGRSVQAYYDSGENAKQRVL